MADGFDYDVFISYSSHDQAWVRGELLPVLERRGLRVIIDFRDFQLGAPSVTEMERAVINSRKTLLVLTPAYLASAWAEFENLMLQTLDPASRQRRLIPLRKEKCDLPLRISFLTYVDFVPPADQALAWRRLFAALGVPPDEPKPTPATRDDWHLVHPYLMPPNFTGRAAERKRLTHWLDEDTQHPLLIVRALGGFGKSALTWHWLLHDVEPGRWQRVLWWSFYEGDASFERFLIEALAYLGIDPTGKGPRQQVDALVDALRRPGTLLILDGFERQLRAFSGMGAAYQGDEVTSPPAPLHLERGEQERDCVNPAAEQLLRSVASLPLHSKVLMTTRLRPRVLEVRGELLAGCREEELRGLAPADAVAFFQAQGVRGSRREIEVACAPYGYHPLCLRLLAGLIVNDLRRPGDIAVAQGLDVSGDLVQRQHHVLEQAYKSLSKSQQRLLGQIACFRSGIRYEALVAVNKERAATLDGDLRGLLASGLLQHEAQGQFDLHPIVRRYAYDHMQARRRTAIHRQLRIYFVAVPAPVRVQTLKDLQPAIELYHHTVRAGQYDEARTLFSDYIHDAVYYQLGAYQHCIELLYGLFPDGEEQPPRLQKERDQGWTLTALANAYGLSGQPRRAIPLFLTSISIDESEVYKRGLAKIDLAIDLGNMAFQQIVIGALEAAAANLRRSIDLGRETGDKLCEAVSHQKLGRLLSYCGAWAEAQEELTTALGILEAHRWVQTQGLTWAYQSQRALLLVRRPTSSKRTAGRAAKREALAAARRALELADETADIRYPHEGDYVRAYWLLGAAKRLNGDLTAGERHLHEALTRCRTINMVDHEADILLDLARLRIDQGERGEALRMAAEALIITERSGYVLQGADVHLLLAQLALAENKRAEAKEHAWAARRLATCDGPPDYTYKVAYEEAGELLAQLGEPV